MYAAVAAIIQQPVASVQEVCRFLEVSRSAYYAWRAARPTMREDDDLELAPLVRVIFQRHRRRYGTRRIVEELRDLDRPCGRRRVAKLLKIQGLLKRLKILNRLRKFRQRLTIVNLYILFR